MKKVLLSPFYPPRPSSETSDSENKTPGPQYLRLASVSLSNTLVIDNLPLHLAEPKKRGSRYLLTNPSRSSHVFSNGANLTLIFFMLGITLLLFQSYINSGPSNTSVNIIPQSWQDALIAYRKRALEMSSPLSTRVDKVAHTHTGERILNLLHTHHKEAKHLPEPERKAIIIAAPEEEGSKLTTEVHVGGIEP